MKHEQIELPESYSIEALDNGTYRVHSTKWITDGTYGWPLLVADTLENAIKLAVDHSARMNANMASLCSKD